MSAPIIRTRGLTKRFGAFLAVDAIDLAVPPGTIFAFLGGNGSGKSTTIRMLIGILAPTAGEIEVDGIDVVHRPRQVRDHIGYMGQRVSLYQGLTLRENVEFYAGLFGLQGRRLEQRWGELRERFALEQAEGERPENLPAGIRQRAGLALGMLHHPRVLFLDEPTAGVDVRSRHLFWDVIREEAAGGTTVFVTTHFLEEVEHCDRVACIEGGKLIAEGAPDELRARFTPGYRITVRGAAPAVVAGELVSAGCTITQASDPVCATIPSLRPATLAVLARLREVFAQAEITVEQPEMAEVFRRMLAAAREAS